MGRQLNCFWVILLNLIPAALKAQDSTYIRVLDINPRIYQSHDTVWVYSGICKTLKVTMLIGQPEAGQSSSPEQKRKLLLTGSGDISYQHFSRNSSSDNLVLLNSSSDIATLRLNLVYKETYPFSIFFRYNESSPFQLDNQYEFNVSFDNRGYKELIRDKIAGIIKNKFLQKQVFLLKNYERVFKQFEEQKQILQSPVYLQQSVQRRIQNPNLPSVPLLPSINGIQDNNPIGIINGSLPGLTSIPDPLARLRSFERSIPSVDELKKKIKDSVEERISGVKEDIHGSLERRRDSLQGLLKKYEDSLALYKDKYNKQLDSVNKELSELTSTEQIKKYADRRGLKDSLAKNRWSDILMKTNIRFGKFILNNSELTVNNIFLHGASIKYGDEKFIQLSAGYYDFAFREMFNLGRDTANRSKQSVIGIKLGKTDGKNLSAVNFYVGKKTKSGSANGELRTVAGISIERNFYFSKNLKLNLELAKSTTRVNSLADKQEPAIKDLVSRFSTRTIGGYGSLKVFLPKTKTDAELNYRYWGQQFESFNASQYFNPQTNLAAKISQQFFNRKLYITSGIRYTDFRSYGIASNMKSKTLFASVNATMRIKKLPIISVGYYPGSQLYWVDNSKLYEYFYYILNTTASHYFTAGKIPMQTVFTWNKFFNKYTDSLVNSSQSFYNIFWSAWAGKFSYQASYSFQDIETGSLSTAEAGLTYGGTKFKLGGSLKWNFSTETMRMGYTGNLGLLLNKIGTINFIYDRSFLPERTGKFIPVTTGELQLIKPLKFRIWQRG